MLIYPRCVSRYYITTSLMPPCRPTCVRLDGRWYDLSEWTHPGGQELIARQAGRDITALFYANHFGNFSSKKALLARLITEGQESDSSLPSLVLQHCSPLYATLKAQVQTHLDKHGLAWRHRFRWEQTVFRFACLFLAWPLKSGGGWAGAAVACAYGLATGRATWTHVHNAVHNPSLLSLPARAFFDADYAGVVGLWMAEHLAHHAHTNGPCDPDVAWFSPLLNYDSIARSGGRPAVALAAIVAYPFLFVAMLGKSAAHALASTSKEGRRTVGVVCALAPLRFGLDFAVLGLRGFCAALSAASFYLIATFVATHQTRTNHCLSSGDWMVDQMRATNNVAPDSALWSWACGGINCHIEHHLFPMLSSDVLPRVAPLVRRFASENGLPYHSYSSPLSLLSAHAAFLAKPLRLKP